MMTSIFTAYLQHTRSVVLYHLPSTIRPCTTFPLATTVAVIDCAPKAVEHMLSLKYFPNLQTIHYLSGHPGRVDLYRTLPGRQWIFPSDHHIFYKTMMEGGWGRADSRLIPTYIDRVHKSGMDLRLPGMGVYPGVTMTKNAKPVTGYYWHLMEYLHTPYRPVQGILAEAFEEIESSQTSHQQWRDAQLEREVMEMIHRGQ